MTTPDQLQQVADRADALLSQLHVIQRLGPQAWMDAIHEVEDGLKLIRETAAHKKGVYFVGADIPTLDDLRKVWAELEAVKQDLAAMSDSLMARYAALIEAEDARRGADAEGTAREEHPGAPSGDPNRDLR